MAKLTNGNISYRRVSCRFLHNSTTNPPVRSEIEQVWLSRLGEDHLQQSQQEQDSIVQWLLGETGEGWDSLTAEQQEIEKQSFNQRYQILKRRYLHVTATQAYRNLVNRLSSIVVLQYNLKSWLTANRDGQRAVLEIVQNAIQEMLKSDSYLQQQMTRIAQCTSDEILRNNLLLASIEEYCLRPVQGQPLLIPHLLNYIRTHQHQKGVLLLLEPLMIDDSDRAVSRLEPTELKQFSKIMIEIRYPPLSA